MPYCGGMETATGRIKTTLRARPEEFAELDRLARAHGVSRATYLIERGLGRDLAFTVPAGLAERVEAIERWREVADKRFKLLAMEIDEEAGA